MNTVLATNRSDRTQQCIYNWYALSPSKFEDLICLPFVSSMQLAISSIDTRYCSHFILKIEREKMPSCIFETYLMRVLVELVVWAMANTFNMM